MNCQRNSYAAKSVPIAVVYNLHILLMVLFCVVVAAIVERVLQTA